MEATFLFYLFRCTSEVFLLLHPNHHYYISIKTIKLTKLKMIPVFFPHFMSLRELTTTLYPIREFQFADISLYIKIQVGKRFKNQVYTLIHKYILLGSKVVPRPWEMLLLNMKLGQFSGLYHCVSYCLSYMVIYQPS